MSEEDHERFRVEWEGLTPDIKKRKRKRKGKGKSENCDIPEIRFTQFKATTNSGSNSDDSVLQTPPFLKNVKRCKFDEKQPNVVENKTDLNQQLQESVDSTNLKVIFSKLLLGKYTSRSPAPSTSVAMETDASVETNTTPVAMETTDKNASWEDSFFERDSILAATQACVDRALSKSRHDSSTSCRIHDAIAAMPTEVSQQSPRFNANRRSRVLLPNASSTPLVRNNGCRGDGASSGRRNLGAVKKHKLVMDDFDDSWIDNIDVDAIAVTSPTSNGRDMIDESDEFYANLELSGFL